MSGHITRMSRGSSVGSSPSSPTSTSRSTSTWRADAVAGVHLHRVVAGAVRRARVAASGAALARRSACSQPSSVPGGVGAPAVWRGGHVAERASQLAGVTAQRAEQRVAHQVGRVVVGTRHLAPRAVGPSASHSAGEGCGSQRCTSRSAPSASSSATSVSGSRVCPKSESRGGRSRSAPPLRSRSRVVGEAYVRRIRRHPRDEPSPQLGLPAQVDVQVAAGAVGVAACSPVGDQRRALDGVRREQAGEPPGHGVAPGRALVVGVAAAEVRGEVGEARLHPSPSR